MKDLTYFKIAQAVAQGSKCLSRRIGAVIVLNDAIVSTGYNGPPSGTPHCNERISSECESLQYGRVGLRSDICPRRQLGFSSGQGLHLCPAAHAETNAIANAARSGTSLFGSTMYLTCEIPCSRCLASIIRAGIVEVVCTSMSNYDELGKFIVTSTPSLSLRVYNDEILWRTGGKDEE